MVNKLAERIREARKQAGISQEELAKRLDISPKSQSLYENGHRVPDANLLYRMVTILNCAPGWLLTGEREISQQPQGSADTTTSADRAHPITEASLYSQFEREYMDKLLIILRYKDESTVSAITQNIDTFLKVPDKAQKKRRAGNDE